MFAFVGIINDETRFVLVNFAGHIRASFQLSSTVHAMCAEFNQKTRELICSFKSGQLSCYCLTHNPELQLVRRKSLRIAIDRTQIVLQLYSLDLVGQVLALTSEGNIICLDAGTFTVTYTIFRHVFSLHPTRINGDKFGTAFSVFCESGTQQQVEIWSVPTDYASCHVGAFNRVLVPASDKVIAVLLESACEPDIQDEIDNPRLIVLTQDCRVHLWSLIPCANSLDFLNSISLSLPSPTSATNSPNTSTSTSCYTSSAMNGFLSVLGDRIVVGNRGAGAEVLIISAACEHDILAKQVLLRPRVPKARIRPLVSSGPSRPMEAVTSQVFVLEVGGPDEAGNDQSEPHILNLESQTLPSHLMAEERLSTPPIPREQAHGILPKTPLDSNVQAAAGDIRQDSIMTDTLRDDSYISEASVTVPIPVQDAKLIFGMGKLDEHVDMNTESAKSDNATDLVAPPTYGIDHFAPEAFIGSNGSNRGVVGVHFSRNLLLRGDGRMQSLDRKGVHTISPIKALEETTASDTTTHIIACSIAYRAAQLAVINTMKDMVNIYRLDIPDQPPLSLPLCVRQQSAVRTLLCADIFIRDPINSPAHGRGEAKTKKLPTTTDMYSAAFVGDSDGYVHFFTIAASAANTTALQMIHADRFRAYNNASVTAVVLTGDCTRPLWTMGVDVDVSVQRTPLFSLTPCAGSAVVTMASDGEVKVWQPHPSGSGCPLLHSVVPMFKPLFRLSGVFTTRSHGPSTRAHGTISQQLALAPGCLQVLTTNGGTLQQWALPGVMESSERALATTQSPHVTYDSAHQGGISSMNVSVPCEDLSMAQEVIILEEGLRDQVLSGLGMYARIAIRSRRTIGYTFAQVKSMRDCAVLVTCGDSLDCSVVVWAFESRPWQHCAMLAPKPVRRLFFSNPPLHGIAFPTTAGAQGVSIPNSWSVSVLLNGMPQIVLQGSKNEVLSTPGAMLQDNRDSSRSLVHFNDDLIPRKPLTPMGMLMHEQALLRPGDSLDLAPVISSISRPPALVQCFKIQKEYGRVHGGCLALLEKWSQVGDVNAMTVVQLENEKVLVDEHFARATEALPTRPQSPNFLPLPVNLQPGEQHPRSITPTGATKHDLTLPPPDQEHGVEFEDSNESVIFGNGDEKIKFLARGLWLEANREDVEVTKAMVEQVCFILVTKIFLKWRCTVVPIWPVCSS